MRKFVLYSLLLVVALNAFGHAGEVHTYMGTVSSLHGENAFMLKTTDGRNVHVEVAQKTSFVYADGTRATRAELAAGKRVVVTISTDGKTATLVKFGKRKQG